MQFSGLKYWITQHHRLILKLLFYDPKNINSCVSMTILLAAFGIFKCEKRWPCNVTRMQEEQASKITKQQQEHIHVVSVCCFYHALWIPKDLIYTSQKIWRPGKWPIKSGTKRKEQKQDNRDLQYVGLKPEYIRYGPFQNSLNHSYRVKICAWVRSSVSHVSVGLRSPWCTWPT